MRFFCQISSLLMISPATVNDVSHKHRTEAWRVMYCDQNGLLNLKVSRESIKVMKILVWRYFEMFVFGIEKRLFESRRSGLVRSPGGLLDQPFVKMFSILLTRWCRLTYVACRLANFLLHFPLNCHLSLINLPNLPQFNASFTSCSHDSFDFWKIPLKCQKQQIANLYERDYF